MQTIDPSTPPTTCTKCGRTIRKGLWHGAWVWEHVVKPGAGRISPRHKATPGGGA
jgi:hypothetical protein